MQELASQSEYYLITSWLWLYIIKRLKTILFDPCSKIISHELQMIFYENIGLQIFGNSGNYTLLMPISCFLIKKIGKKDWFKKLIWEKLRMSECYDAGRPSSFDPVCDRCFTMSTQSKPRGRSPLSPTRSHCLRFCDLLNCSFFTAAFFSMISSWSCNNKVIAEETLRSLNGIFYKGIDKN